MFLNVCIKIKKYRFLGGVILKMRDEEKTKDQLIKEMQKMREKSASLEEVKLKYNQVDKKLKQAYEKLQKIIEGTANIITKVVETRDPYSTGHQQKVSKLATVIAQEMKLSQDKIEGTKIASLVHDIGKINTPAEILSKPSKLNEMEFNLIKNHPKTGYNILKTIDFPWPVARIVLQHHERLDGSGYPQGLKGDKILLEAKIIGTADVVEAMSSHRPYRPAKGIDKALEEISKNKGILYDPEVVDACPKLFKEKSFNFES
jgi:putative nucleotidyltransferase with HDIG domain